MVRLSHIAGGKIVMLERLKPRSTDANETGDDGATFGGSRRASESEGACSTRDTSTEPTPQVATPQHPAIGLDEVFGILQNRRRRDVLRYLLEHPTETRLGDLAEQIAARECGKAVSKLDSQERKRVYISLYQCHLPKLADVGVIDYDKPRGIIERDPAFDHVTSFLPTEELTVEPDPSDQPLLESVSAIMAIRRFFE